MRAAGFLTALCLVWMTGWSAWAQTDAAAQANGVPSSAAQGNAAAPVLRVRSNLVLVPALVKTRHGDVVFALQPDDFTLTDDGVPQKVRLEPDTDSLPLALVIVVQTGRQGAAYLGDYAGLETVLETLVGAVPHTVAVVSFDSHARLAQGFSANTDNAAGTLAGLTAGDDGAAILDGLALGTDELRRAPASYRRALLLISETIDSGSKATFDETLQAIGDTNTAIYSLGLSSTKTALTHEGAKLPNPLWQTRYSATPYAAGGCMSKDANADPDAHGKRSVQALDCASDLLPPLRVARMAYIAAKNGFQRNVPESVAVLTGGEYYGLKDARTLTRDLILVSKDVPNRYVLSFQPVAPHPGLHALALSLKARPELVVDARHAYWIDGHD